jgi:Tfp pilus assembly protein PilZ
MQHKSKSVFLAILSRDKEEERAITRAIGEFEIDYVFASTVSRLRDAVFEQPCNGIGLCIKALVGADQAGKSFVQTLEQVYPVARIRWNKAKGSLALIASRSGRVETLSDFVTICSNFAPRRLRRSERLAKTLNVLLSSTPDLADPTRAFTINISPQGCFLHTPLGWNVGDTVFIRIQELSSASVIEGKIIRYVPWGTPFHVQGVGIQFVNLENRQIEELQHLLYYLPVGP